MTALGALAANQPPPVGAAQVKRGVTDSYTNYTSSVAYGTVFPDGAGGLMQISATPSRRCYWLITAEMIWSSPDGQWSRGDWAIGLNQADLDGYTQLGQCIISPHSAVGWMSYSTAAMFRLEANTAYVASMNWRYSSGYNQQFSTGPLWHKMFGLLLAEAETV